MYKIKRWRIRKYDSYIVKGDVYGNPKFADGGSLRTSPIKSVERKGTTIIFHTMNSGYECSLSDHVVNCDDLPFLNDFGSTIIAEEEISALSEKLKAEDEERIERAIWELQTFLPEGCRKATIIEFDEAKDYYFSRMLIHEEDKNRFFDEGTEYVNIGMFQDSVHLGMIEDGRINPDSLFRYFPYQGNRLEFYAWSSECEPVFILNTGVNPLEVDTPYGKFLIPYMGCCLIDTDSTAFRIQESVAPAIDRYSVWEAHVDENGGVSYGAPREDRMGNPDDFKPIT